jgi:hypothetical protein
MKRKLFILFTTALSLNASAQFVAKMELKEDVPGICSKSDVYVLFESWEGQQQAVCPASDEEILNRLNSEVQFLKDNPKYKDKGMIGILINCEGKVVRCEMDNKTKEPQLDSEIEKVFNSLGAWTAGKLNNKNVDSNKLFSFVIKKGRFSFD